MRRVTDAFAVVIALAAFGVSYSTQVHLAMDHGFGLLEAFAWPAIADAAALCMILRLHFGGVRPGFYTVEAWGVFILAGLVMVGANAVADWRDPLGAAMHGCVPFVAAFVWHVIIHGSPVTPKKRKVTAPADDDAERSKAAEKQAAYRARQREKRNAGAEPGNGLVTGPVTAE